MNFPLPCWSIVLVESTSQCRDIAMLRHLRGGVFSKENWYMSLEVEPSKAQQAGSALHSMLHYGHL